MKAPKSILITGASSGIGEALAYAYAAPDVSLHLAGRNQERLEAVAMSARQKNATVTIQVFGGRTTRRKTRSTAWLGIRSAMRR